MFSFLLVSALIIASMQDGSRKALTKGSLRKITAWLIVSKIATAWPHASLWEVDSRSLLQRDTCTSNPNGSPSSNATCAPSGTVCCQFFLALVTPSRTDTGLNQALPPVRLIRPASSTSAKVGAASESKIVHHAYEYHPNSFLQQRRRRLLHRPTLRVRRDGLGILLRSRRRHLPGLLPLQYKLRRRLQRQRVSSPLLGDVGLPASGRHQRHGAVDGRG